MGFDKKQREALKTLSPGTFYAVGPAISNTPVLVRTGKVQTVHPGPGKVTPPVPPPPEQLKALIEQLQALPTKSEESRNTQQVIASSNQQFANSTVPQELRANAQLVTQLRQQIAALEQQLQTQPVQQVEVPVFQDGEIPKLEAALNSLLDFGNRTVSIAQEISVALNTLSSQLNQVEAPASSPENLVVVSDTSTKTQLSNPQQRILDALAEFETLGLASVARHNLAVFSDQSPTSGGYTNNLGRLRGLGLIDYPWHSEDDQARKTTCSISIPTQVFAGPAQRLVRQTVVSQK